MLQKTKKRKIDLILLYHKLHNISSLWRNFFTVQVYFAKKENFAFLPQKSVTAAHSSSHALYYWNEEGSALESSIPALFFTRR